jgi:hypothetical protein
MSDCPLRTSPASHRMEVLPRERHHATHGASFDATSLRSQEFVIRDCVLTPAASELCGSRGEASRLAARSSEIDSTERSSLRGEDGQGSVVVEERRTLRFSGGDGAYPTDRILGGERLEAVQSPK